MNIKCKVFKPTSLSPNAYVYSTNNAVCGEFRIVPRSVLRKERTVFLASYVLLDNDLQIFG